MGRTVRGSRARGRTAGSSLRRGVVGACVLALTASLLSLTGASNAVGASLPSAVVAPQAVDAAAAIPANVTVGRGHACALMPTGYVWCWGRNDRGQLGYPSATTPGEPRPVPAISTAVQVVAGDLHTCARLADGTVKCWGANGSGQLGNASTVDSSAPVTAIGLSGVTDLTAGRAHTCAVANGLVSCWGSNGFGQLGLGSVREARLGLATVQLASLYSVGIGSNATDDNGDLVLSDAATNGTLGNGSVVRYGDDGVIKSFWSIPGSTLLGGVATSRDGSRTYVANTFLGATVWVLSGTTTIDRTWNVAQSVPGCLTGNCSITGLTTDARGTLYAAVRRSSATGIAPGSFIASATKDGLPLAATDVTSQTSQITDVTWVPGANGGTVWVLGTNLVNPSPFNPFPTLSSYAIPAAASASLVFLSRKSAYAAVESCVPSEEYVLADQATLSGTVFYRHRHTYPLVNSLRLGTGADGQLLLSADYSQGRRLENTFTTNPDAPVDIQTNYTNEAAAEVADCVMVVDPAASSTQTASVVFTIRGSAADLTDVRKPLDATESGDGGIIVSDPSYAAASPARLQRFNAVGSVTQWGRVPIRTIPTPLMPLQALQPGQAAPTMSSVFAGAHHTCASGVVNGQPTTLCWGNSSSGQTGWPASGASALRFGLPPSDTGDQSSFPIAMPVIGAGVGSGGLAHTCIAQNGTPRQMTCWGANDSGQTRLNTVEGDIWRNGGAPTTVPVTELDSGDLTTCTIESTDLKRVQCYGSNAYGQTSVGPGSCLNNLDYVQTLDCQKVEGALHVSAGPTTTCAATATGIVCWGDNTWGTLATTGSPQGAVGVQLGVPSTFTVSAPATLDGSVVARFATNLDTLDATTDVVLRVKGSTRALAGTKTVSADRRTLSIKPAVPLVAGQQYEVAVNSGSSTVLTSGGLPLTPSVVGARAATALGDTSPANTATWPKVSSSTALGGSYVTERTAGATAKFTFTGSSVTLLTRKGPSQGKVVVSVGAVSKTVDLYSATAVNRFKVALTGLGAGPHTLTVKVLGTRNTRSTGTSVAIDGISVGAVTSATPTLTPSWAAVTSSTASAKRYVRSQQAGATYTVTFRGTRINWLTFVGPDFGDAKVVIDGKAKGTFALYATATKARTVAFTGLTDAVHKLTVTVTGTGKGTKDLVAVDGWTVS